MKAHTQTFKENLITLGKEIDAKVTYTIDGVETELDGDTLGSVTPHYEGNLLKSVMKQVDIISDVNIPLNTEVNVQFGMKYNSNNYEYIDYGNYIVFSSEKQEDTNNYKIIAYDKMLYAMKDYESLFDSNLYNGTLEQGTISSTGELNDATYRVRSASYLEVEPNTEYTLSTTSDVQCFVFQYQEDETFVSRIPSSWTTSPYTFTTGNNINKLKFAFRKSNDADITPEEVENIVLKKGTSDTIIYPVTINQYIEKLCNKIGLEFANSNEIYCNYDKEITQELYSNLGYTYRDVLDQLAQVTASTICINNQDQLEIRYLNESANESEEVEGTNLSLIDSESARISGVVVEGNTTQETTLGTNYFNALNMNNSNIVVSNEGQTITMPIVSSGNGITGSGRTLRALCPTLKVGDVVYLKFDRTPNNYNNFIYLEESAFLWSVNASRTITQTDLTSYVDLYANRYSSGETAQVTLSNFRIVKNNSDTWEKFTYGASPNPNYPQDINIITGRQEVEIVGQNKVDLTPLTEDNFATYQPLNSEYVISEWTYDNELKRNVYHFKRLPSTSSIYPAATFNLPMNRFNPKGKNWAIVYRYKATGNTGYNGSQGAWIGFNGRNNWEAVNINSSTQYIKSAYLSQSNDWNIGVTRIKKDNPIYDLYSSSYTRMSIGLGSNSSMTIEVYVSDIMVVEITDEEYNATTYTPPDFQEYQKQSYEINLGKNLFKNVPSSASNDYLTMTNDGKKIHITGSSNGTYYPSIIFYADGSVKTSNWYGATGDLNASKGYFIQDDGQYTLSVKTNNTQSYTITIGRATDVQHILTYGSGNRYAIINNQKINFIGIGFTSSAMDIDIELELQLEKGKQRTQYSPYFEPIQLGEIGDYKDNIFKNKGTNLLDRSSCVENKALTWVGGVENNETGSLASDFISTIAGYKYSTTFSSQVMYYDKNKEYLGCLQSGGETIAKTTGNTWKYFTTPNIEEIAYMRLGIRKTSDGGEDKTNKDIMLNKGYGLLPYEPYGIKNKWYIEKQIGKVVLTGSENWINDGGGAPYKYVISDIKSPPSNAYTEIFCNNYLPVPYNANWNNYNYLITRPPYNTSSPGIKFRNTDITTGLNGFKTWLSTHNTEVYYVLATPTTTEITKDNYPELLSQLKALDKAKTYEGYTSITSSFPIKFSYATDYETINEDYIKNVRASFGEKYGPINSIVLSRSAESDNIYIQDEESIEENGLCEVKIKDNQIMNDNNRSEFLPDLLEYLKGIEYYINDFESIGITYLDLCDKYKVQIGDTKYDCIMFNDEVDIHDGLNEVIYTDKPETSVTDYKKASTTDKLQRQTNLIVDKQNQRIEAIVSDSEDSFASINVELGKISSQVQGYDVTIDELGNEIQTLRSSYTEQTPTMISDWFDTNLKSIVDDLQNTTSGNDEEIRKIKAYIRRGVITDPQSPYYNQAYIELGDETNQTTLRILQNRIQFLTNGQETAFISNNQLYINESTILTKEKIGNWVTTQDEDGLLNTYWED